MMKRLITYLKEGTRYYAVEVTGTDSEATLFFISIQKQKNTLKIVESVPLTMAMLPKKIKRHVPLFVLINTPQVLTKVIPSSTEDSLAVVDTAFPNIKTAEFHYEWVRSGKNAMVAICRKAHVNTIFRKLKEAGFHISGFALGALHISTIQEFLPADNVVLPHTRILLKDGEIMEMEKTTEKHHTTYEINGITLENSYLPGFATILSSVLKNSGTRSDFEELNTSFSRDFYNRRFLSFFLKFSLGFLLLVLLTNAFFFSAYYKKTTQLQETLALKSADKNQVQELSRRVTEKQHRVEAILASSSSKSSLYLDKIATALPLSVLLDNIRYQPVASQLKQGSELKVERNVLIISGLSKDSNAFSRWVETMEKWDWVQHINIRDYDYSGVSTASFAIQIIVNHEQ